MRRPNLLLVAALAVIVFTSQLRAANTPQNSNPPTQSDIDAARKALDDAQARLDKAVRRIESAQQLADGLAQQQTSIAYDLDRAASQAEADRQVYAQGAARVNLAARDADAAHAAEAQLVA